MKYPSLKRVAFPAILLAASSILFCREVLGSSKLEMPSLNVRNPLNGTSWASQRPISPIIAPETYRAIAERPIFVASRRPPSVVKLDDPPTSPFSLALVGILSSPSERFVVAISTSSPDPLILREGETVGSWTVFKIKRDEIVVRSGAESETIKLSNK